MQNVSGLILKSKDFRLSGNGVIIKTPSKAPGMLLIHAEWCGHCKRFIPTFNELSNRLGKEFVCASIESAELENASELVSALNFKGFPTICFFDQNGKITQQYDGQRDIQSMLNAICKLYHKCYM